jgi:predicted enzyme related to lactoylglutathione lyase
MSENTESVTSVEIGPGTFCWHEVNTRTPAETIAFHTAVFGWTTESMPVPKGSYTLFKRGDDMVGGCLEMTEEWPADAPEHWQSYVAVADVRETAGRVESLGGAVMVPPFEVPIGVISVVRDPGGGVFSLFQGGDGRNPVGVGTIAHNELLATDLPTSVAFYEGLIGWTTATAPIDGQAYHMFMMDGAMKAGAMAAPPEAKLPCNMWLPYVQVEDVDATIATVVECGGKVAMPPSDIPTVGRIAVFTTPQFATLAIWTPAAG